MNLRCKPGDLAVIVNRDSENYGKFVTVVRPYVGELCPFTSSPFREDGSYAWIVEGHALVCIGSVTGRVLGHSDWSAARDSSLLPIRDSDGDDETLTWAGKPNETPADFMAPRRQVEHAR